LEKKKKKIINKDRLKRYNIKFFERKTNTMNNYQLEIAKQIGEPISYKFPVPVELNEIADVFTAEVGEKVWRYTAVDSAKDTCLAVDAAGAITLVKRTPTGDAELTFGGLNSKLEYVLLDDILSETDNTQVLGRRKASITRSMDKRELYAILTGIVNKTAAYVPGVNVQEYTLLSGDDLYDVALGMKHLVENYGDNYVFLAGSTVKEKIDTYDKDNASTFNYNVTLTAKLKELGINVMKIFGNVELTDGGGELALLDAKKAIMVAKNSRIQEGKPIKFVRRKISPEIAKLMGASVDSAQRMLIFREAPLNNAGVETLGYGVYGYESIIFTITNPKAICFADLSSII